MSDKPTNRDSFLKRSEYYIKKLFDKFLENSIIPILITKPEIQFNFETKPKILILRNDRIGDLLISIPTLRIIKNKFPDFEIDALISDKNIGAKRGFEPYISNLYIYRKNILFFIKLIIQLKKNRYDLVIDLFDNPSTTNALIMKLIKPSKTLGIRKKAAIKYTFEVLMLNRNQNHIVDRTAQLLLPFGINPKEENLTLEYNIKENELSEANNLLGGKTQKFRFGINLSGSSRDRYWGFANFKKLIAIIDKKYPYFEIVIFSTPEYKLDADNLTSCTNSKTAPLVNNFNIYAAMLSTCDILLTPDTSAVHLASAFKIPCASIGLYTWSGLEEFGMPWIPYKTSNRYIAAKYNLLALIDTGEVFNAIEQLIIENNLYD
jgi:ADP-heptose:LPS heptosyltransferase